MAIELHLDNCINPTYIPHLSNKHRYQIYYGGSASGKSVFLAQRCVINMMQGKRNYLIVRNVRNTLRHSCFNEIQKQISAFKLHDYFDINKSEMVITHKQNGRQILFSGLDDAEKIKSITPAKGVITDIWVEEATETDRNDIKQLDKRLRGQSSVTKRLTLSFNPILRDHWIYSEYFSIWTDDSNYAETDTVSILKTTYKDNLHLMPDDIANLENETDKYYYDVYTLGNWGVLGSVIFRNWRTEDFSDIESTFDNFKHGIDWGFGSDPFAYIKCHYDKTRNRLYICDEICSVGLLNNESAEMVKPLIGRDQVICDSAEPKSIAEYRQNGINAIGAKKGQGSVEYGIKRLQEMDIIIHPKCQNAINEFIKYRWKEDRSGSVLPIPIDRDNHLLDALRYSLEDTAELRIRSL